MADDTPTVEQAKRALSSAIADYGEACRRREGIHTVDALPDRIDALIAAVRAEQSKGPAGSFGYCPVCYHPLDGCSNCGPS